MIEAWRNQNGGAVCCSPGGPGRSSTEHGCVVSGVRGQPGVVRQGRDRGVLWTDFGPKDLLKGIWVPQFNILQKDSVKSWVKEEREMHKVIRVREDTG